MAARRGARAICVSAGTRAAAATLLLAASAASAQYVDPALDWKEADVPQAPAFDSARLIPIDAPRGSSLKFGIDPETISIGADGVVRYVVIASSAQGANNVLYEGIRCSTGEYRLYARWLGNDWSPARGSDWQSLYANMPSKHPLAIAQAGVCTGRAPNGPVATLVRALRSGAGAR